MGGGILKVKKKKIQRMMTGLFINPSLMILDLLHGKLISLVTMIHSPHHLYVGQLGESSCSLKQ
eukprot:3951142-Ditylum_brightwellii.AAC.1